MSPSDKQLVKFGGFVALAVAVGVDFGLTTALFLLGGAAIGVSNE